MGRIIYLLLSFCLGMIVLLSCDNNDDDKKMAPSNISNVTTEALEGAIRLSWDVPSDSNYLYIRVSYKEKGSQGKDVSAIVSSYTNNFVLEKIYKKYGEYEFALQTFSKSGVGGEVIRVKETSLAVPPAISVKSEKLTLDMTMLTASSEQLSPNPRPLSNLINGNLTGTNFYHSLSNEPWPQWIQVALKEPLTTFKFKYWTRPAGNNGDPKNMDVLVSSDGINFEKIVNLTDLPTGPALSFESEVIAIDKPFTHIRLNTNSTHQGNMYYSMTELEVYAVEINKYDPESEE